MKRILLSCLLSSVVAIPALAALKEGDIAPDFKAPASLNGKEFTFSLKDALKEGPVVVYFYPAAYTGGCNVQARTFAVQYEQFAEAGASIIGVSLDNIARLNDFSADPEYCGGKVPVASDEKGEVAKSYDLEIRDTYNDKPVAAFKNSRGEEIGHSFTDRTTFVVTADGKIAATIGDVSPEENVGKALEVVQRLAAKS